MSNRAACASGLLCEACSVTASDLRQHSSWQTMQKLGQSESRANATFNVQIAVRIGLETGPTATWPWTELKRLVLPIVCIDARHAKAVLRMQINNAVAIRRRKIFGMMACLASARSKSPWPGVAAVILMLAAVPAAIAADCGNDAAGFHAWLARFKLTAAAQDISPATISSALAGVSYDPTVIRLDRSQRSFKLSFKKFYAYRIDRALIRHGQSLMRTHHATLERIEKRFGVPAPVIIAIWGLETNYGADSSGKFSVLRSLATLAYDCRRSEFFTGHLLDALRIVQRGDLTPAQLRGGWAGEIGHTQFLPSGYYKYAIDFDGDGHRDLERSIPDMLASTANFLKGHGWKAGQGWGPGSANYAVIKDWNKSEVYQRTIAVMASKLAERP